MERPSQIPVGDGHVVLTDLMLGRVVSSAQALSRKGLFKMYGTGSLGVDTTDILDEIHPTETETYDPDELGIDLMSASDDEFELKE